MTLIGLPKKIPHIFVLISYFCLVKVQNDAIQLEEFQDNGWEMYRGILGETWNTLATENYIVFGLMANEDDHYACHSYKLRTKSIKGMKFADIRIC